VRNHPRETAKHDDGNPLRAHSPRVCVLSTCPSGPLWWTGLTGNGLGSTSRTLLFAPRCSTAAVGYRAENAAWLCRLSAVCRVCKYVSMIYVVCLLAEMHAYSGKGRTSASSSGLCAAPRLGVVPENKQKKKKKKKKGTLLQRRPAHVGSRRAAVVRTVREKIAHDTGHIPTKCADTNPHSHMQPTVNVIRVACVSACVRRTAMLIAHCAAVFPIRLRRGLAWFRADRQLHVIGAAGGGRDVRGDRLHRLPIVAVVRLSVDRITGRERRQSCCCQPASHCCCALECTPLPSLALFRGAHTERSGDRQHSGIAVASAHSFADTKARPAGAR